MLLKVFKQDTEQSSTVAAMIQILQNIFSIHEQY